MSPPNSQLQTSQSVKKPSTEMTTYKRLAFVSTVHCGALTRGALVKTKMLREHQQYGRSAIQRPPAGNTRLFDGVNTKSLQPTCDKKHSLARKIAGLAV